MLIWPILIGFIIVDIIFAAKWVEKRENQDRTPYMLAFLFIGNYIPLALFEVYQNDIYLCLNSLGFTFLGNINFLYFLRSSWSFFLNFLQYSSSFYWYCFWISGFVSLTIEYDYSKLDKACWSCFFGMINPLFFLLYSVSAEDAENFILFLTMMSLFIITWTKIYYCHDFSWYMVGDVVEKYNYLIIISAIFLIKRHFFSELDIFDVSFYFLSTYFTFGIAFLVAYYFTISYVMTYDYLNAVWKELQEKKQRSFHIEDTIWKICKIYALIAFFTYAMILFCDLAGNLLGKSIILKEALFMVGAAAFGSILIYPEDGDFDIFSHNISNSFAVYFEVCIARMILHML
ncbi:unnamed protein product [Blepharisma stoltei]|uniref:Uncharacterized protein n=1 Tax=Blepharisma stoltei TaxID=1481888 RepID=A0AAU9I4W5_9CILI|nr:unnamed protein product [Blepharisma stoltei]